MGRSKNAVIAVFVILLSGVVALFVAEAFSRIVYPAWAPRTGRLAQFWQYDAVYGWSHKPGQEGRFESFGFDTSVRINSHGFRGPELSFNGSPADRRIIVLGDSFVWGFGVEENQTFPHLLEQELPGDTEVINLGVSGYSTDQELLVYRNIGRKYQPNLVVLVVATNDVAMNVLPVAYLIYGKPVFRLENEQLHLTNQPVRQTPWVERIIVGLAAQSYLLNQLNRVREEWNVSNALAREAKVSEGEVTVVTPERKFPQTEAELVTVELIAQIGREVEADGAKFLVVLVDGIYAGQKFSSSLRSMGIQVVALDDVMAGRDEILHLPDNLHWNPAGHRLVLTALKEPVIELLEGSGPASTGGRQPVDP